MVEASRESSPGGRNWKGGTVFRNATTVSVTTDVDEEWDGKQHPADAILANSG
jgi:hypothetical protein